MTFLEFQHTFSNLPIIPKEDINKFFPDYDRNALTRWQKAGYVDKIRNGYYQLTSNKPSIMLKNLLFLAKLV